MAKKNPKDDIDRIRANLDKAQGFPTKALDDISFQKEMLDAISPYWNRLTPEILPERTLASATATLQAWADETEIIANKAQPFINQVSVASSVAANVGSVTATLYQFGQRIDRDSEISFDVKPVSSLVLGRLTRNKVKEALSNIDKSLADTYGTIWQYMSYPALDRYRGPLYLMRQVFDHFLDKMAPDTEVKSQSDFRPNAELKKKDGKGITRRHRIEYLATTKGVDPGYRKSILSSTDSFLDVYDELNKAHKKGSLDQEAANRAVIQGEVLLQEWLRALGKLP